LPLALAFSIYNKQQKKTLQNFSLVLTLTVITFRRVSVNQQHFQHTSGSYIDSVCYYSRLVTEPSDNERGDIEIQDYVFLPHGEDDRIHPRTLVMDVTMTHDRYGRTTQHTNGALTHRVPSTGP
jgi:hypothetical protein